MGRFIRFDLWLNSSFRDGPKDQTRNLEIPGSRSARPGMTSRFRPSSRRRGFQQPLGGGARFRRDLGAGQHAGDFLAAVIGGERVDAGGDALALVQRIL